MLYTYRSAGCLPGDDFLCCGNTGIPALRMEREVSGMATLSLMVLDFPPEEVVRFLEDRIGDVGIKFRSTETPHDATLAGRVQISAPDVEVIYETVLPALLAYLKTKESGQMSILAEDGASCNVAREAGDEEIRTVVDIARKTLVCCITVQAKPGV